MANVFVTEFRGWAFNQPGLLSLPALASQQISIGTTASTGAGLSANTNAIMVSADAGAMLFVGSSGSTGVPSSTSGFRIPASAAPIAFAVAPYSRIAAIST